LNNPKIDSYLNDVAERVIKTGEKVSLTGHTDSFGPDDTNYGLGLKRANILKDILIAKGVPEKNIIVKSKGEKSPVAPNDTPANRSKNRRVELKILK
ncbi:MAG TPA: OmpA family protein, partial [Bacteroidetes bacterium]|nr:OmpA family protein [Bacteroidota bacterium]